MHILHLMDPPRPLVSMRDRPLRASMYTCVRTDAATGCPELFTQVAANIQAQTSEHKHTFCLVGPHPSSPLFDVDQPKWDEHVCPPFGKPELGAAALRGVMARLDAVDVVQSWSFRTHRLAKLACGRTMPCSVVLADIPAFEGIPGHVHRRALRDSNVVVLCDTDRALLGDAMGDDFTKRIQVAPVPVFKHELNQERRAQVRDDLQLVDHEVAILLAGDPVTTIDVGRIEFVLSSCTIMGLHPVALVPRGVPRIEEFRQHLRKSGRFDSVRFVNAPASTLLDGADLALLASGTFYNHNSRGLAELGIARVHAHGVPCIAPASIAPDSLYPDEDARACLAFNSSLPEVARVLARLIDDAELRARAAASVAQPFETTDRITQFSQALGSAWESSINTKNLTSCRA